MTSKVLSITPLPKVLNVNHLNWDDKGLLLSVLLKVNCHQKMISPFINECFKLLNIAASLLILISSYQRYFTMSCLFGFTIESIDSS